MKKNIICPISNKKINENVARMNGVLTMIFLLISLNINSIIPILFLSFDFLIRGLDLPKYSPFSKISNIINDLFSIKPIMINAGTKIFASRVGFLLSLLILLFYYVNLIYISIGVGVVFFICALLESLFNYCLACKIYPYFYMVVYKSENK